MLDIQEFLKVMKGIVPAVYYPMTFPATGENNCVVATFSPVISSKGDIKTIDTIFYIRNASTQECVTIGKKLIETLDYKTNLYIKDVQIILLTAVDTMPNFQGKDSNGLYIYKVQIRMLVDIPLKR